MGKADEHLGMILTAHMLLHQIHQFSKQQYISWLGVRWPQLTLKRCAVTFCSPCKTVPLFVYVDCMRHIRIASRPAVLLYLGMACSATQFMSLSACFGKEGCWSLHMFQFCLCTLRIAGGVWSSCVWSQVVPFQGTDCS